MGCSSSVPVVTKEQRKRYAPGTSHSPAGHPHATTSAHRKLAKREAAGSAKTRASSNPPRGASAADQRAASPSLAAAGGAIPSCYGAPTLVPVHGRTVQRYGPHNGEVLLRFVPLGGTKSVVVHCPTESVAFFLQHMDRYAFTEPSRAAAPPPSYADVVRSTADSPTAAARSLPIKDDPRNYDLSPESPLRPVRAPLSPTAPESEGSAVPASATTGADPAPAAGDVDHAHGTAGEAPGETHWDVAAPPPDAQDPQDLWAEAPLPSAANHFFLPTPRYPVEFRGM
ncbi:hypothetical protein STCU_10568 [Strigomonas culicis]|uniref:Uncharacterized protein n=1 Tax=Strigomonas culicis TaxID=28005 RepID=S9V3T4_9TRYP|nr:hypothetical protein STCU_10568 [Strigomonas culicis]|eukprot:EPY17515.1 hypothetical protein STCU_10568 [Strigomonas culicis]